MRRFSETSLQFALERILKAYEQNIGHNDSLFLQRVYGDGLEKYLDRLNAIGVTGLERVLDAGCGFGQWSLALSVLNKFVYCCDASPQRIAFLNSLLNELDVENVEATDGNLEKLCYEDEKFDAVFCYSVLYASDPAKSLDELIRVLKPGGALYICSNGIGWYFYNIEKAHQAANDFDPCRVAMDAINNTMGILNGDDRIENTHTIVPGYKIKNTLTEKGFSDIKYGAEGTLRTDFSEKIVTSEPAPFFPGEYKGFEAVFEILAIKNG